MNSRQWCRAVQIYLVLCGRLANAATESGVTSTVNSTGEAVSSPTPAPGGTEAVDSASVGPTEAAALNFTQDSPNTTLAVSEAPTVATEEPPATTAKPLVTSEGTLHLFFML